MSASTEMPRYRSHKEVWAMKITHLDYGSSTLTVVAGELTSKIAVDGDWMRRNTADGDVVGGYYVVYEDGYKSWSPAEAFEKGYTQVYGEPNKDMTTYAPAPHVLSVYENYVQAVKYARLILKIDPVTLESYDALLTRTKLQAPADSPIHLDGSPFAFDYTPTQRAMAYEMKVHLATKGQL